MTLRFVTLPWSGRARSYLAESKPAMARKDLERVLAEDSRYPAVKELLNELDPRRKTAEPAGD